jgi:hypothetical protein
MSWLTVVAYQDGAIHSVHVLPADDDGIPLPSHVLTFGCPCRPKVIEDNVFRPPVMSHREPFHPGANTPPDA